MTTNHTDDQDSDPSCPFCHIAKTYSPYPPSQPPSTTTSTSPLDPYRLSPPSFILLSTPLCLAFLDIQPLAQGHMLLSPRRHSEKISDVTSPEAAEMGRWIPILSRALARVTGVHDWNVVQNNGAAAAQVVPHVHWHIIPRPALTGEARNRSFTMFGRGQRSELDEDGAEELAGRFRRELAGEVERLGREGEGFTVVEGNGGRNGKL